VTLGDFLVALLSVPLWVAVLYGAACLIGWWASRS
jgi:hypothetical protein